MKGGVGGPKNIAWIAKKKYLQKKKKKKKKHAWLWVPKIWERRVN